MYHVYNVCVIMSPYDQQRFKNKEQGGSGSFSKSGVIWENPATLSTSSDDNDNDNDEDSSSTTTIIEQQHNNNHLATEDSEDSSDDDDDFFAEKDEEDEEEKGAEPVSASHLRRRGSSVFQLSVRRQPSDDTSVGSSYGSGSGSGNDFSAFERKHSTRDLQSDEGSVSGSVSERQEALQRKILGG
jgi:hypothetical protein